MDNEVLTEAPVPDDEEKKAGTVEAVVDTAAVDHVATAARINGAAKDPAVAKRNVRFKTLLPVKALTASVALVVGVGAVGRRVAHALAQMGVKKLILMDPDVVAAENIGNQGWPVLGLDKPKVAICKAECEAFAPGCDIKAVNAKFTAETWAAFKLKPKFVFSCVDDMGARLSLATTLYNSSVTYIDTRMFGNYLVLWTKTEKATVLEYLKTLVPQTEVFGNTCDGPISAPWTSMIVSGLAISQWVRCLHNVEKIPITPYLQMDLRLPYMAVLPYKQEVNAEKPDGDFAVGNVDARTAGRLVTAIDAQPLIAAEEPVITA